MENVNNKSMNSNSSPFNNFGASADQNINQWESVNTSPPIEEIIDQQNSTFNKLLRTPKISGKVNHIARTLLN